MISKKCAKAINAQINREFFSAFLYLAMANDAMDKGFKGVAKWFQIQFKEEQEHALKFSKYLEDQGEKGIPPPDPQDPLARAQALVAELSAELARLRGQA